MTIINTDTPEFKRAQELQDLITEVADAKQSLDTDEEVALKYAKYIEADKEKLAEAEAKLKEFTDLHNYDPALIRQLRKRNGL